MSEYQCYEFVSLDRALPSKEMAELRSISGRAEITPTRFWSEYRGGDLKADPAEHVERGFDAHIDFANWGTHRLMLRVQAKRVDATTRAIDLRDLARCHGSEVRSAKAFDAMRKGQLRRRGFFDRWNREHEPDR